MPMDVCHIFLGKPWQYDRNAMHDWMSNTYATQQDGENHTILPLKDESVAKGYNSKVLLVSVKEFLHQLKNEEVSFL